ncbi:MAG: hypothetical protein RL637_490 [Pseudomonadota bacterium]|jgi:D-alanine-D-alanine ligase
MIKPIKITDAKAFGRVAVLMGGMASERDISLRSGQAVLQALCQQQVDAVAVDIGDNPLTALHNHSFDRAFNCVHGRGGEDGILPALLELLQLPYTGSGVLASALAMDKLKTKLCWRGQNLPTPAWIKIDSSDQLSDCIQQLGLPLMVKPASEGSSIGMNKAHTLQELYQAVVEAQRYGSEVYVEQWVHGDEYTVGILDGLALPVIRLQTDQPFYDYVAKYQASTTQYHCPCGLSIVEEQRLQKLALIAANTLGVKGWGRVDVFIDQQNQAQLIEVNTVPGMTDHSLVPMAAAKAGIDFGELVWRILETSFN